MAQPANPVALGMPAAPPLARGAEFRKDRSGWQRAARQMFGSPLMIFGLGVMLLVIVAVLAPLLAPGDPTEMQLGQRMRQPSLQHVFGTDALGPTSCRASSGVRASRCKSA